MFAGCLQIMWAHSHLIRAGGVGYSQIIRAENTDVCRSCDLCLQAATANNSSGLQLPSTAFESAKKVAPGLDVYFLEAEWRGWMANKPRPKNPAGSFVGFCKSKYEKNI